MADLTLSDALPAPTPAVAEATVKASHKSFRRKYRKIMVKLEEKMRDSTALFRDEQKILDITRRLVEQNDRILEMLVEANSYPQIPASLRYDLSAVGDATPMPDAPETLYESTSAPRTLNEAHHALRQGRITQKEFSTLSAEILSCPSFAPTSSYKDLLSSVPHTTISLASATTMLSSDPSTHAPSYLTVAHEESYISTLDGTTPPSTSSKSYFHLTPSDREKFFQLTFPASMYNWLRRERPEVFLQDTQNSSKDHETPKHPSTRKSKKAVKKEVVDDEPAERDDDDHAPAALQLPAPTTPRESTRGAGKRKRDRDDDGGYRPKGGNSRGGGGKRRREAGDSISSKSLGASSRGRKGGVGAATETAN